MSSLDNVKTRDHLNHKQWIATSKKIGTFEEHLDVLRGKLRIELVSVRKKLFDKNGRRIPPDGMRYSSRPDKNVFMQPPDVKKRHQSFRRYRDNFGGKLEIDEFSMVVSELIDLIDMDEQYKNLLKGPFYPIILPWIARTSTYNALVTHKAESIARTIFETVYVGKFKREGSFLNL
ncbi:MAG: hypothetical protein V1838_05180 [Patescibacteria group bacterium]